MNFGFKKLTVLPTTFEPHIHYLVKRPGSELCDLYIADSAGSKVYHVASEFADGFDGQDVNILSNGEYVWARHTTDLQVMDTAAVNAPTRSLFSSSFFGQFFSPSVMNEAWCEFVIPQDIALATKVYPHIYTVPSNSASGVVRWGISYLLAKGHGQQSFDVSPTTVYIEQTIPVDSARKPLVAEVSVADALLSSNIEPGSALMCRIFRDAEHVNDTYQHDIHAKTAGLFYMRGRIGTRNRSPNFFS